MTAVLLRLTKTAIVDSHTTQASFYVDGTNGSDENAGTENEPFKTVERAKEAVRDINDAMTGDIYVYIKGGTYQMAEPLTFDEHDSGMNGFNVIYFID